MGEDRRGRESDWLRKAFWWILLLIIVLIVFGNEVRWRR